MVCSSYYQYFNVRVCTDAATYTARATSIDCTVEADESLAGAYTWDYKLKLQELSSGKWKTVDTREGYFKRRAFPSFSLSGKRAGTYRVSMESKRRDVGHWSTSVTGTISVKR